MLEYTKLPSESAQETDFPVPAGWPSRGEIVLNGLSLRYRPDLPTVLNNLTLRILPGEKVGVVGRTGAGKSSLTLALFRMVEPYPAGCLKIDGVETQELGLRDLRSKISIIPQEPFLFKGTVRFNLDPFCEHSDDELWSALEAVELKPVVQSLEGKLEAPVQEHGSNFSVGERQLVCLARAILRNNRVIVMDECTANVDAHTDKVIQESIRTHFASSTVITIAHRLHTIIDYDRILVLNRGEVAEFDSAANLLRNPGSMFSSMVQQTGPETAQSLTSKANAAAASRHRASADTSEGHD